MSEKNFFLPIKIKVPLKTIKMLLSALACHQNWHINVQIVPEAPNQPVAGVTIIEKLIATEMLHQCRRSTAAPSTTPMALRPAQ
jgi:hypothetical protein